jgi:hypothetical protein
MSTQNPIRKGVAIFLCLLVLVPRPACAQSREYQIKAAFLFNFAQFIEWPAGTYATTNTPFSIGILGDDPFGAALDDTVQGETIANHKLVVRRSQQIADLADCQMIFVSKSERKHLAEILSALDSRPVLTVSEVEGFARNGGGINFYLDGTKVRFEINPDAAQNDRLKISSQLLSLGKIVPTVKEAP